MTSRVGSAARGSCFIPLLATLALRPAPSFVRAPVSVSRTRLCSSAKGASLAEVLVALAFTAVFSIGAAALAITVVTGNAKAKSMDIAVYLAHDRLEAVRNTAYASITAANFPPEAYGSITVGNPAVTFPDHERSVSIQDDTPTSGVKRVLVTVSWQAGRVNEETLVGQ